MCTEKTLEVGLSDCTVMTKVRSWGDTLARSVQAVLRKAGLKGARNAETSVLMNINESRLTEVSKQPRTMADSPHNQQDSR